MKFTILSLLAVANLHAATHVFTLGDLTANTGGTTGFSDSAITSVTSTRSGSNYEISLTGNFDSDTTEDTISFIMRVQNQASDSTLSVSNSYFLLTSGGGDIEFRLSTFSGVFSDGVSTLNGVSGILNGTLNETGDGSITFADATNSESINNTATLTNSYDLATLTVSGTDNALRYMDFEFTADVTVNSSTIPEPTSIALLGLGGVALVTRRHRKG